MSDFQITGVTDRGATSILHYFEIYGSFNQADLTYAAYVNCNGALLAANIEYRSANQFNISIPERPTGSTCLFYFMRSTDPKQSNVFGPIAIAAPEIEIRGVKNRGVTDGRQYFELYGRFPGTGYGCEVTHNGMVDPLSPGMNLTFKPINSVVEYQSQGQINISTVPPPAGSTCRITVIRGNDRKQSPIWSQRMGSHPEPLPSFLGAYFWGGFQPSATNIHQALPLGLQNMEAAGFKTARFLLTPSLRRPGLGNVYNFDLTEFNEACPPSKPFLPCAVRTRYYQDAFASKDLQTIVLTTYDSASHGPMGTRSNFFDPAFFTPQNAALVRREYRDLTVALFETQRDTGKNFIIANWETDNHLYCAGAYAYVVNANNERQTCDQDPLPPRQRIAGFIRWFQLRKEGIKAGRQVAARLGYKGVEVHDAIEIASYNLLHHCGFASTLFDIVPQVKPDYVSYSAWESANSGTFDQDLREIQQIIGTSQLIIGELGQIDIAREDVDGPKIRWRFQQTINAIRRAEIPVAIIWQAYPTVPGEHNGILDTDGSDKTIMLSLRQLFLPAPQIMGIRYVNMTPQPNGMNRHYLELYGEFAGATSAAGAGYKAEVTADNMPAAASVIYESKGQINIAVDVPPLPKAHWCTFTVRRQSDRIESAVFGPYPVPFEPLPVC